MIRVPGRLRSWGGRLLRQTGLNWVDANARWGVDVYADVRRYLGRDRVAVVFDVGANEGSVTTRLLKEFPSARVHAFEPASEPFADLARTFQNSSRVIVNSVALSSQPGEAVLYALPGNSKVASLTPVPPFVARRDVKADLHAVAVERATLDDYCNRHAIEAIDLLKIDTEGHDLEVLKGGYQLLAGRRVRSVICEFFELGSPEHPAEGALLPISEFLRQHGYWCAGLYTEYAEPKQDFLLANALFLPSHRGQPICVSC